MSVAERFWDKVITGNPKECWVWTASKDGHGYGQLRCDKKNRAATHISLELAGKPRPSVLHVAMHICDNPPCVNPDHLRWGTRKENQQDALRKGRMNLTGLRVGHEMSAAARAMSMTTCHVCGSSFKSSPTRLRVNVRNYCSRTCCLAWQSQHFSGRKRAEFCL